MKNEIIDMHCHLLPGIDDGAKTMEDTIKALHMASEQGVKEIIVTPHYNPNKPITPEKVIEITEQVQQAANAEGIDIELHTGMECLYFSELPELIEQGKVLTLAGSRYVLVEFFEDTTVFNIEKGMEMISEAGFIPILAHYERYRSLMKTGMVKRLKDKGFLLQMNYDTIQRVYGLFRSNPFRKDIKNEYVDFLGSDCHGSEYRKYFLNPSVEWLEKNLDKHRVRKLICGNPRMIVNHEY